MFFPIFSHKTNKAASVGAPTEIVLPLSTSKRLLLFKEAQCTSSSTEAE